MNTIIEKIRAEVERLMDEYKPIVGGIDETTGANIALAKLHTFLATLEEEPVEIDFEQELYNHFGQVKDFTLGMRIGKYFYELGREHQRTLDADLGSPKYERGFEDGREYERKSKEQPVCDELEEEIKQYYSDNFDLINGDNPTLNIVTHIARHFAKWGAEHRGSSEIPNDLEEAAKKFVGYDMDCDELRDYEMGIASFIAGYNLCKEQTEKRWLEDRDGCFWDGVEEGKKAMREQMMKEAVEVEVTETCGIASVWIKTKQFKPGQKVKIIIVKED